MLEYLNALLKALNEKKIRLVRENLDLGAIYAIKDSISYNLSEYHGYSKNKTNEIYKLVFLLMVNGAGLFCLSGAILVIMAVLLGIAYTISVADLVLAIKGKKRCKKFLDKYNVSVDSNVEDIKRDKQRAYEDLSICKKESKFVEELIKDVESLISEDDLLTALMKHPTIMKWYLEDEYNDYLKEIAEIESASRDFSPKIAEYSSPKTVKRIM